MTSRSKQAPREFVIVEDALDLEQQNERLQRPRLVDEEAQARAEEPPVGEGTYLLTCIDCARPFRSNDLKDTICRLCDADTQAQLTDAWGVEYAAHDSRFRRGRRE